MSLHAYAKKRRFAQTPEPREDASHPWDRGGPIFVVQLHHARARHYDFRLEIDGALKSWAVPKGPSLRPEDKRLAVEVEDHPLEYAAFEGDIPRGQYGAGHVAVFDRGTFTPIGDPLRSLSEGKLEFELAGRKLRGAWKLVRTSTKRGPKQWLLMKSRDAEARDAEADDLIDDTPAVRAPLTTTSKRAATTSKRVATTPKRVSTAKKPRATVASKRVAALVARASALEGARIGPVPADVAPELAVTRTHAPPGDDWLHEVKWDGYRLLANVDAGIVTLRSRQGLDFTSKLPTIRAALEKLGASTARLDGELVVLDSNGRSDFGRLQRTLSGEDRGTLRYELFDLLALGDVDLRGVALLERKALLEALLARHGEGVLLFSSHVVGSGDEVLAMSERNGLEGIVSKRTSSKYTSTRSSSWAKVKHAHENDFVVVGFTRPKGARSGFGALLLARHEEEELRYKGRVGSGFDDARMRLIAALLRESVRATPPLVLPKSADVPRDVRWVEPTLVVDVAFRGVGKDGILRQPSFVRLRDDLPSPRSRADASTVTHPERVVFPKSAHTKRDVVAYYACVADWMLPELRDRPLALVRCPDGIGPTCFFQKHADRTLGAHVRASSVREGEGRRGSIVYVADAHGLVELAQHNVVEFHAWGSRVDDAERPDRLVLDLDPGEGVVWPTLIDAAREVRARLADLGLESFVRLTGGNGLHVVVPIRRGPDWDEVKRFTQAFAEALVKLHPLRYVATMGKTRRRGRIFVDYLRNGRGATSVASWSLRARDEAGVAMPLRWEELGKTTSGATFDLESAMRRARRLRRDPWEGIAAARQSLPNLGRAERASAQAPKKPSASSASRRR